MATSRSDSPASRTPLRHQCRAGEFGDKSVTRKLGKKSLRKEASLALSLSIVSIAPSFLRDFYPNFLETD